MAHAELLKNTKEIGIHSKPYGKYADCLDACKLFMDTVAAEMQTRSGNFHLISWKANPAVKAMTHEEPDELTKAAADSSTEWDKQELLRMFIADPKRNEGSKLTTVAALAVIKLDTIKGVSETFTSKQIH